MERDITSICYNLALPGLMPPTDNPLADDVDGSETSGKNSDSMYYTDANGDINIRIDGPYAVAGEGETDPIEQIQFKVFISKENAREKYAVMKNFGAGKGFKNTTDIDLNEAVLYSELDADDPTKEYFYLKIRYTDLALARGTYVVRIFKETAVDSGQFESLKVFTLTVRSNPIQGPYVNRRYINTANRFGFYCVNNSFVTISADNSAKSFIYLYNKTRTRLYKIYLSDDQMSSLGYDIPTLLPIATRDVVPDAPDSYQIKSATSDNIYTVQIDDSEDGLPHIDIIK